MRENIHEDVQYVYIFFSVADTVTRVSIDETMEGTWTR